MVEIAPDPRKALKYSPDELKKIHDLYMIDGLSAGQIANHLRGGMTRNAVLGIAARNGWKKPYGTPAALKPRPTPRPRHQPTIPAPRTAAPMTDQTEPAIVKEAYKPKRFKAGPAARIMADNVGCKFPVGRDAPANRMDLQLFCGEIRESGQPYCDAHCRVAFHKWGS